MDEGVTFIEGMEEDGGANTAAVEGPAVGAFILGEAGCIALPAGFLEFGLDTGFDEETPLGASGISAVDGERFVRLEGKAGRFKV